jgi:hypothetical protein
LLKKATADGLIVEAKKKQQEIAGKEQKPVNGVIQHQSPFLTAFHKTGRVWDDAAKSEWADDVERRLRKVLNQIHPRPKVLGYVIYRVGNSVGLSTVTSDEQGKQEMAALSAGHWPCWNEIVDAVPELSRSTACFEACTRFEWERKWDVEDEMSRFRSEHGVFE